MDNYYEILGLKKGVLKSEIDKTFKILSSELKVKKQENKKLFNDELDIVTAAYNKIIDDLKNDDKIRYIKCPKNHFYDENLKKCPECEGDDPKNVGEGNSQKNEQELIDELNNAVFGNPNKKYLEDEIENSYGDFGYVKTNPIPINGLAEMYQYLPKLRYLDKSETDGKLVYHPVKFIRTQESDNSKIGSKIFEGVASATSSPNIGDNIDVFNLYDINNLKIAKIYLHGYQNFTSKKAPKGLYLSDNISPESVDFEN